MFDLEKYDLYSKTFKANVYETYDQLRAESPIRQHKGIHVPIWFVTGYKEAKLVLADKRFVKNYRNALTPEQLANATLPPPEAALLDSHLLNLDPPDHTRLRSLVGKAFTTSRIQGLRPRIQQIADELLDKVLANGRMDLIDDYAFPLPIIVICEMLGVPAADRDKFRVWSNAFIETPNSETDFMQKMMEFIHYLTEMFALRRANPQDDMLSDLIAAEENGERLSEPELYSMMVLLLVAGHETTVNLIANSILALLQNPDQRQLLENNMSLLPQAIEEFLRYDGPVERATTRYAAEDIEIEGQVIQQGSPVIVVLAGAERDPRQFNNPNQLDITRSDNKHMGFGYGIHYCLGAPLARLEGEIAIRTLLQRLPNLQLAVPIEQLTYRLSPIVRGPESMPVVWD